MTYVLSATADPEPRRRHRRCGGSWPRSSAAARWRGADPRVHQGLHQLALQARARDRHRVARRRRVADDPLRPRGRQLQRLLEGHADRRPDGGRLLRQLDRWASATPDAGVGSIFAFGLVAFGFLCMGPVNIAVDSYGPVTDNAQSVFELAQTETHPRHQGGDQKRLRLRARLRPRQALPRSQRLGRQHVQGHRQAGADRHRRRRRDDDDLLDHPAADQGLADQSAIAKLSSLHAPVLLGFICGGAVIYWFCGASMQAVTTGAYRAVEYIKKNMKLDTPRGPTSRTPRRSSRSAPSTPRRACGTSSSP